MVGKLLGECKRRREPEEISVKERVDDGARGEGETLKRDKFNRETVLSVEVLFVANTGVKGEGPRHRPAWILQG